MARYSPSSVAIPLGSPPEGREAGLLLSRGRGRHLTRTRSDWELIVVRRGRLPIAEDGVDRSIGADEYLLLAPGREHRGTAAYGPDLEFHWLHFAASGRKPLRLPVRGRLPDPPRTRELLLRYPAAGHPLAASGIVLELLASLIAAPAAAASPLAERADAVIARCFHQPLSTADVARELGVHPDHLGRIYAAARGCTVLAAIQRRRIADAQALLLAGGLGQRRIAADCGFSDERYFRRVFRALVGCAPGAWLARHAAGDVNSR